MAERKTKLIRPILFEQYKTLKDDIIETIERRFENKLNIFEKRIVDTLRKEMNEKTESLRSEMNNKFDSQKTEMRWLIGILFAVLTTIMTLFKFIK